MRAAAGLRVVLLADTHLPVRPSRRVLPGAVWEAVDAADVVVHETGDARGRERRCDGAYAEDTDVLVFGHSHVPWDTTTARGLRLLNPGSPTERRRQPDCTFMTATVRDAALTDVALVAVPGPSQR